MTEQELFVFETHKESILVIADKLKVAYAMSYRLNEADAQDFAQRVLLESPAVLLGQYSKSWEDEDAIRAFLYSFFANKLRDIRKQAKRKEKFVDLYALVDEEQEDESSEVCCDKPFDELAKTVVDSLMPLAPPDVQAICRAFMDCGSWSSAGESLGWSKGKIYRTQQAAKKFFEKNVIFCGEFVELAPKRK